MADLKQIALQRKLAAAELIGDTEQVARLQQRLAALPSSDPAVSVVRRAPRQPKAKPPAAAPRKRAAVKEPAAVKKAAEPAAKAARKRSKPKAVDVVFTPATDISKEP